ncbi:hypothetical protein SLEP1_g28277 [Rubroshorea leprosula]|uniref:Uncharacterized protein n=1 Tax=Rubroshorea leprosula TaxID=152421 RepID=A0AAV5JVR8_9ROSI|nr:hypothetical protein SLEP1_g28277 [Rubroshorea leprosula]
MSAGFHRTQICWVRGTQLLGSRNPVAGFEEPSCWVPVEPIR